MNKRFFIALTCLTVAACTPSPRQQNLQLIQSGLSIENACSQKQTQTDKVKCEGELLLLKAKEINYPYYGILDTTYSNRIILAEKYDNKKITKKQYDKEDNNITMLSGNLIRMSIEEDEKQNAIRSAKFAAAGQALSNLGASISNQSNYETSQMNKMIRETPPMKQPIRCSSSRMGRDVVTTCD